jgi:hypothetical protein
VRATNEPCFRSNSSPPTQFGNANRLVGRNLRHRPVKSARHVQCRRSVPPASATGGDAPGGPAPAPPPRPRRLPPLHLRPRRPPPGTSRRPAASLSAPSFHVSHSHCFRGPCHSSGARGGRGGARALPRGPGESLSPTRRICILGMTRSSEHILCDAVGCVRRGSGHGGGVPCCWRRRCRQKAQLLPTGSAALVLPPYSLEKVLIFPLAIVNS